MMGVFVQVNEHSRRANSEPVGYIIQESGCWDWVGGTAGKGYGAWAVDGKKSRRAHRVMYELVRGPIPEGMTLDHLCRNRGCVNPDHLEPVNNRTNVLRGIGHTARNAHKTNCFRGHELSGPNVYLYHGHRRCRECYRIGDRARRHRERVRTRMTANALEKKR